MMRRRVHLTNREWKWLWVYTRTGINAGRTARIAYGGTPISIRVKGHKKKVKLKPILDKIDKIWDGLLEIGPDGWKWKKTSDEVDREVDAYLNRLKRRIRKSL
jgi:hypothetical protein